jgi:hypothetical protein
MLNDSRAMFKSLFIQAEKSAQSLPLSSPLRLLPYPPVLSELCGTEVALPVLQQQREHVIKRLLEERDLALPVRRARAYHLQPKKSSCS